MPTSQDDLLLAIGRLEGKLDSIISTIKSQGADIDRMEQRLRKLEQSKSWMLGAAAVIGAVSSVFIKFIGEKSSRAGVTSY